MFYYLTGESYAAAVLSGNFPFCSGSRIGCVSVNLVAAVYDRRIISILRNGAGGLAATTLQS